MIDTSWEKFRDYKTDEEMTETVLDLIFYCTLLLKLVISYINTLFHNFETLQQKYEFPYV